MRLDEGFKNIYGIVDVEVQGFFTERYINLCKINNITIWDIVTITNGIIRFKIAIKDFKKLKIINRKTKCKVKVINKKGMYFNIFKYRKRWFAIIFLSLFIALSIFSTKFIWNINISGNYTISDEKIIQLLSQEKIHVGKCFIGLNTRDVVKKLRSELDDAAWIGVELKGVSLNVEIVEKTKAQMNVKYQNGDVLSSKAGIITKIVAENGTPISNVGDYIEKDRIVIEGKIYTRTNEVIDVEAMGRVYINSEYNYSNTYEFKQFKKVYDGKEKYSIGVDINDKENYINYLDKSIKYDIIKSTSDINVFGNKISFAIYKFLPYYLEEYYLSEDEIIQKAKEDAKNYIESEVLSNCKDYQIINIEDNVSYLDEEKISLDIKYTINEEVGYFRGRE